MDGQEFLPAPLPNLASPHRAAPRQTGPGQTPPHHAKYYQYTDYVGQVQGVDKMLSQLDRWIWILYLPFSPSLVFAMPGHLLFFFFGAGGGAGLFYNGFPLYYDGFRLSYSTSEE